MTEFVQATAFKPFARSCPLLGALKTNYRAPPGPAALVAA